MHCVSLRGQEEFASFALEESLSEETDFSSDDLGAIPIDINQINRSQLALLDIFSSEQQDGFFRYREKYGPILSVYELQAIPELDQECIMRALPFLNCRGPGLFEGNKLSNLTGGSETQWTLSSRYDGGVPESDQWKGSPIKWQFRFRNQKQNKYTIGLQLEKDAGEGFQTLPDYLAGYVLLEQPVRFIHKLILGDFRVNWGQGLVLFQGFQGFGGLVDHNRGPGSLTVHTGMDEYLFFRGLSLESNLKPRLNTQFFISHRRLDATFEEDGASIWAKNIKKDGLHRTQSELEKKGMLSANLGGLQFNFSEGKFRTGLQGLYNHFSLPLNPDPTYYNKYYFRGRNLINLSLDHHIQLYNVNVFGELAWSNNGALALIQGINMSLGKTIQLALSYRNYGLKFQTLYGNPISNNSQSGNEQGLLWNLALNPLPGMKLSFYTDLWAHKSPVYQIRGPSGGFQQQLRLEYQKRKQYLIYLLLDIREKNGAEIQPEEGIPLSLRQKELKLRLHLEYRVNPSLTYRCRLNIGTLKNSGLNKVISGASLQQDLIYQPNAGKIHFSARVAIINTEDYDIRFYNFENGLLNQFSIVPYYGKGLKSYLNIRYRGIPATTLEAGINHQSRPGGNTDVGFSGTRISFQIRQKLNRS